MRTRTLMPTVVPDVAIVTYNTDFYLLNLLDSLQPLRDSSSIGEVHVWDNASSDRTGALLHRYTRVRPWLHAVRSSTNVHHGPALDALLRECCRSEWVLLLDADTEIRRSFTPALRALDLVDATFVGQMHPQMRHLYAYLAHLLVHRPRYLELPPFTHHGAPGIEYFRAVEQQRRPFVRFRWCDYVHHFGQGALRRIVERGDDQNEFYAFARTEHARSPKTPDRLERERALDMNLRRAAAAIDDDRRTDAATTGTVTSRTASPPSVHVERRDWPHGVGLWMRSPRWARWLRQARRLGLVQQRQEALQLARFVEELRPRGVVEIGTSHGGSFLLWARAAAPDATLVSIDLPPWELDDPAEDMKRRAIERVGSRGQAVHVLRGSSHDPAMRRRAAECFGDRPIDFLFIDGDHSYDGVSADFREYGASVRPGGMIALHDIHPHSRGWGGEVSAFWREIRQQYRHAELIADPAQDGFGIGLIWV